MYLFVTFCSKMVETHNFPSPFPFNLYFYQLMLILFLTETSIVAPLDIKLSALTH